MENKIQNTTTALGWLEKILGVAEKYKLRTIFKTVLIILIMAGTVGFIQNPTWIFEQYEKWKEKQHQEQMDLRAVNNDKIQHLIEKSLYKIEADRIMILELHNGNESIGGLPFNKCSATFEYMDNGLYPCAELYQNQQLSLIPFASHLFSRGYFCGDLKDLEPIDRGLYHKMASNGTEHFAACVIEGIDKPLAFLIVSFKTKTDAHNCDLVREQIRHISLEIAVLLELNRR